MVSLFDPTPRTAVPPLRRICVALLMTFDPFRLNVPAWNSTKPDPALRDCTPEAVPVVRNASEFAVVRTERLDVPANVIGLVDEPIPVVRASRFTLDGAVMTDVADEVVVIVEPSSSTPDVTESAPVDVNEIPAPVRTRNRGAEDVRVIAESIVAAPAPEFPTVRNWLPPTVIRFSSVLLSAKPVAPVPNVIWVPAVAVRSSTPLEPLMVAASTMSLANRKTVPAPAMMVPVPVVVRVPVAWTETDPRWPKPGCRWSGCWFR